MTALVEGDVPGELDFWDVGSLTIPQLALSIIFVANVFVFVVLEISVRFMNTAAAVSPAEDEEVMLAGAPKSKGAGAGAGGTVAKGTDFALAKGGARGTKEKVQPMDWSFKQVRLLSHKLLMLSAILFYAYMCENHPLHPHGKRLIGEWDTFWFVAALFLGAGLLTWKRNEPPCTALLGRDQTEEWKGWMQFLFVEYHYFHAVQVYNPIRIFVSSYVWMTGFGNFSFFYIKRDFSFVRMAQMFWRLNFLVLLLVATMDNMYILYYIVPLHTFYFFLVTATMWVGRARNHDPAFMRRKIFAVFAIIFFVWDCPGVFDALHAWWMPHAYPPLGGILHEWHFRSYLDHYSSAIGMIFALNYPVMTEWLKRAEALPGRWPAIVKGTTLALLLGCAALWMGAVGVTGKYTFNARSPYSFFLPVLCYIFARNCSVWLRSGHLTLFAWAGKITLETYLLQHHVLLTSNAKTLLVLIPGFPTCNLLLVTSIYLLCALKLYRLTLHLRAMAIPDDNAAAMRYLKNLALALMALFALASAVKSSGMRSGAVFVAMCCFGAAALLAITKGSMRGHPLAGSTIGLGLLLLFFVMISLSTYFTRNFPAIVVPTMKPPPHKRLFVGCDPAKGAFTLLFAGLMIFFKDSFFGASWLGLKCAGGQGVFDVQAVYDRFHKTIGVASAAPDTDGEEKSGSV